MKLTYDEFRDTVVERIKDYLPEKYADSIVTVHQVMRNNDTKKEALAIRIDDQNFVPAIYLNEFYGIYLYLADASMDFILEMIAARRVEKDSGSDFDDSCILNFDQVKDQIFAIIVNSETNKEYLADCPHTDFEDLAVTYHIDLGKCRNDQLYIDVTNKLMKSYSISIEELHKVAMENTFRSQTVTFNTLKDTLKELTTGEMIQKHGLDLEETDIFARLMQPLRELTMYVLTNENRTFGSIHMMNQDVMDIIIDEIGGDVYILPSSVHEVIIVPVENSVRLAELENMVRDVNQTKVRPEDFLSDHVYYYDAREHKLTCCR